jgi:hypothetical protein
MDNQAQSDLGPPKQPIMVYFYLILGAALWIESLILAFSLNEDSSWILFFGVIAAFALGGISLLRYERLRSVRGESLLISDKRPPILYLRSFDDEVHDNRFSRFLRCAFSGKQMSMGTPAWGPREQAELAKLMNKIGPYIAIGRPGESMPELGAARMYISDQEWKSKVRHLMDQAKIVVIRAGKTEGLRWEVSELVNLIPPKRVLIILPQFEGDYDPFRNWADQVMPVKLPDKAPKDRWLMFDSSWKPILLPTKANLNESLAPFLEANNIKMT